MPTLERNAGTQGRAPEKYRNVGAWRDRGIGLPDVTWVEGR